MSKFEKLYCHTIGRALDEFLFEFISASALKYASYSHRPRLRRHGYDNSRSEKGLLDRLIVNPRLIFIDTRRYNTIDLLTKTCLLISLVFFLGLNYYVYRVVCQFHVILFVYYTRTFLNFLKIFKRFNSH
jgi:hypothetical protein